MIEKNEDKNIATRLFTVLIAALVALTLGFVATTLTSTEDAYAATKAKKITKVKLTKTVFNYGSHPKKSNVKVYAGKKKLSSKYYKVTYYHNNGHQWVSHFNSIPKTWGDEPGCIKVVVKGKNGYKGTKTARYYIVQNKKASGVSYAIFDNRIVPGYSILDNPDMRDPNKYLDKRDDWEKYRSQRAVTAAYIQVATDKNFKNIVKNVLVQDERGRLINEPVLWAKDYQPNKTYYARIAYKNIIAKSPLPKKYWKKQILSATWKDVKTKTIWSYQDINYFTTGADAKGNTKMVKYYSDLEENNSFEGMEIAIIYHLLGYGY